MAHCSLSEVTARETCSGRDIGIEGLSLPLITCPTFMTIKTELLIGLLFYLEPVHFCKYVCSPKESNNLTAHGFCCSVEQGCPAGPLCMYAVFLFFSWVWCQARSLLRWKHAHTHPCFSLHLCLPSSVLLFPLSPPYRVTLLNAFLWMDPWVRSAVKSDPSALKVCLIYSCSWLLLSRRAFKKIGPVDDVSKRLPPSWGSASLKKYLTCKNSFLLRNRKHQELWVTRSLCTKRWFFTAHDFIEAQINSISMRVTWIPGECARLFCFPAFYGSMWKSLWFKCLIPGEPEWWRAGTALRPTICLLCCSSSVMSPWAQTSYLASLGSDLVHSRKKWTTWFTQ